MTSVTLNRRICLISINYAKILRPTQVLQRLGKMGNCTSNDNIKHMSFQEVKDGLGRNEIYLIDVRTAAERHNPGRIPGSLHVPLSQIGQAFSSMTPEEFASEFDFKRPALQSELPIVLSCKSGVRASQAANQLFAWGYENLAIYKGSFNDWMSKGGKYITSENDGQRIIDMETLCNGLANGSLVVIDVRNPAERQDPGHIPGTHNVPLGEIWTAFAQMTDGEFSQKYGFAKPDPLSSGSLALHCLRGKRALDASDKLLLLGYDNVKVYKGSFMEWKSAGKQYYSSSDEKDRFLEYDDIRQGLHDNSLLVVDVRNPSERQNPGFISGTKNIPLSEIWQAFSQCSDEEFEAKYGFSRPSKSSVLATHCLKGKRAMEAAAKLNLLGYQNVKVYKGSLSDWKEKGGEIHAESSDN